MNTVIATTRSRTYPIRITDTFRGLGADIRAHLPGNHLLLVSDEHVAPLYADPVDEELRRHGMRVSRLLIAPGEPSKSVDWLRRLWEQCLSLGLERSDGILALGGGVVGDLAGFAAATYLRGIRFFLVPTTLLAQVDASVGGKVAVNVPQGKNLLGAFYQPHLVWINARTLATLRPRSVRDGLAELIKHALIKDETLFRFLGAHSGALLCTDAETMIRSITTSVGIKAHIVAQDEREEAGIRELLNFGHTVGHALETLTGYNRYAHGEAVALGMHAAAIIGVRLGVFSTTDYDRMRSLLHQFGLPGTIDAPVEAYRLEEALQRDKKARAGKVRFVLLRAIGEAYLTDTVPLQLVHEAVSVLLTPQPG